MNNEQFRDAMKGQMKKQTDLKFKIQINGTDGDNERKNKNEPD
jgi:hypothetical protein